VLTLLSNKNYMRSRVQLWCCSTRGL